MLRHREKYMTTSQHEQTQQSIDVSIQEQLQKSFTTVSTLPDDKIPLYYGQYYRRNKIDNDQEQLHFDEQEYDYGVSNKVLAEAVIKDKQLNFKQLSANVLNHLLNRQYTNNLQQQNDVQLTLQFNKSIPNFDMQKKKLYQIAYFWNLNPVSEQEFKIKLQKQRPNIATNSLIFDLQMQSNTFVAPDQNAENTSSEDNYEVVKFNLEHSISKPEKYITQIFNKYLFCNVKINARQFDLISECANRRLCGNTLFRIINNPVNDKFVVYQFLGQVPTSAQFDEIRIQIKEQSQNVNSQQKQRATYERTKLTLLQRLKEIIQCPQKRYYYIAFNKPITLEKFTHLANTSSYKVLSEAQLSTLQDRLVQDQINIDQEGTNYIFQKVPLAELQFKINIESVNDQFDTIFLYKLVHYTKEGDCTKFYVLGHLMTMSQLVYLIEQSQQEATSSFRSYSNQTSHGESEQLISIPSDGTSETHISNIVQNQISYDFDDNYRVQVPRHFLRGIDNSIYMQEQEETPLQEVNEMQEERLNQLNQQKMNLYRSISESLNQEFLDKLQWRKEQYEENYRLYMSLIEQEKRDRENQEQKVEQLKREKQQEIDAAKAAEKKAQSEKWRLKILEEKQIKEDKINFETEAHQKLMKNAIEARKIAEAKQKAQEEAIQKTIEARREAQQEQRRIYEEKVQKIQEAKKAAENRVVQEKPKTIAKSNIQPSTQTPDTQFIQNLDQEMQEYVKQIDITKSPNLLDTSMSSSAKQSPTVKKKLPELQIYQKKVEFTLPAYQSVNQDFPKVAENVEIEPSEENDFDISLSNEISEPHPVQKKKKKSKSKSYDLLIPQDNTNLSSDQPEIQHAQAQSYKNIHETQDDLEIDLM